MKNPIVIEIKKVYGIDQMYIVSEHKEAIQALTGRKTIHAGDLKNLKSLGFEFEVATPTLPSF